MPPLAFVPSNRAWTTPETAIVFLTTRLCSPPRCSLCILSWQISNQITTNASWRLSNTPRVWSASYLLSQPAISESTGPDLLMTCTKIRKAYNDLCSHFNSLSESYYRPRHLFSPRHLCPAPPLNRCQQHSTLMHRRSPVPRLPSAAHLLNARVLSGDLQNACLPPTTPRRVMLSTDPSSITT